MNQNRQTRILNSRRWHARKRGASLQSIPEHCAQLGYASYQHYLQSSHWQEVRRRWYASGSKIKSCWCCERRGLPLQLHHRTYKNMGHERMMDLVALCGDCHQAVHDFLRNSTNSRVNIWNAVKKVRKQIRKAANRRNHDDRTGHANRAPGNALGLLVKAIQPPNQTENTPPLRPQLAVSQTEHFAAPAV